MASSKTGRLTSPDLAGLSSAISKSDVECIALSYLGMDTETLEHLDSQNDTRKFIRAVFKHWENKQVVWNTRKELAAILYRAAKERAYVDPVKIRDILKISRQDAEDPEGSDKETIEKAVEDLKKHIKEKSREMCKPEMAPWSHDVTTNMADVDFRLLEVSPGLNTRKKHKLDSGYNQLFEGQGRSGHYQFPGTVSKVFVTGCHGSGKTLLSKKIVHDWALGEFNRFPFVFVLFMEELGSIESLVQAVVDQYGLEDKCKETLTALLSEAAHLCLFILDGVGSEFLLKSVSYRTNILVTTQLRADTISKYKMSLPIFELASLCKSDACKLVSNKSQSEAIVNSLSDIKSPLTTPGGYNPMLVMFMSVLESREPGRLVGSKNLTLCEIYLQLVLSLYDSNVQDLCEKSVKDLCSEIKSNGRVVFDSLQLRKKLPNTGPEIDFLRKNGLVVQGASGRPVFVHGTLGLFLGALYFILEVSQEMNCIDLVGADSTDGSTIPLFLSSPLFLYFCLSLLRQTELPDVDKEKRYRGLKEFVAKKFDCVQIDLRDICEIYPALKCTTDCSDVIVEFLSDVLVECSQTEVLFLNHKLPVIKILKGMGSSVFELKSLVCLNPWELLESEEKSNTELHVVVQNQSHDFQHELFEFLKKSGQKFSCELIAGELTPPLMKISDFAQSKITLLSIKNSTQHRCRLYLEIQNDFEVCEELTHLSLVSRNSTLTIESFQALTDSAQGGKLPKLSSLNFRELDSNQVLDQMPILLKTPLPKLTELDLSSCSLNDNDVKVVFEKTLPRLASLRMNEVSKIPELEKSGLKALELKGVGSGETPVFDAVCDGKFPELTLLKLSGSSFDQEKLKTLGAKLNELSLETFGLHFPNTVHLNAIAKEPFLRQLVHLDLSETKVAGKEYILFRHLFPKLESLNLRGSEISEEGVRILAQVNKEGNFQKLKHLDLSGKTQNMFFRIQLLSCFGSKWRGLTSFCCSWTNPNNYDDPNFDELLTLVQSGCLGSLETLVLQDTGFTSQVQILQSVVDNIGVFSGLRDLYIHAEQCNTNPAELRQTIRSHNISLHLMKNK